MKFYIDQPMPVFDIFPDIQNRNCDAWFQLLELIDRAVEDKRAVFNPSKELGGEVWNQITVLPRAIKKLKNVKELMLYGSNLTRIPPEIAEMTSLEKFTPYTSYGLKWFPYEITTCKQLKDSTVSTRALYGNYKHRTIFPSLADNPVKYFGGGTKCSVCKTSVPIDSFNQYWLSLRVATDVLPLLVNICSEECLHQLPKGTDNYLPYPHKGGKDLHQPS